MAFLRFQSRHELHARIGGDVVTLRQPVFGDYAAWKALRGDSRAHLTPWEPTWALDELTQPSFRRRVRQCQADATDDNGYGFLVFRNADNALLGGMTLANVRRGAAQSAMLGYWTGAAFAGQGYMTCAVATVLPYAFTALGFHRVEAACMTNNAASIRVLEKCGFVREGLARGYLKIDGHWRDHLLFAASETMMHMVPARGRSA